MRILSLVFITVILLSCSHSNPKKLEEVEIEIPKDLQTAPEFTLVNHLGDTVGKEILENKIAVVDFFFTTCPTICPIMKSNMLNVYDEFKDKENFIILSHTIDPEFDTQEVLNDYSKKLGITGNTWYFLTGDRDHIYDLAEYYHIAAEKDESAPGGFIHSGAFILLNSQSHIIGIYDGTVESQVEKMINHIRKL
jgi:protein SCO1/2